MKDKLTLWIVGLALDKNKQTIVGFVSVAVGFLTVWLGQNLPEWAQFANSPELLGLLVVAVINVAVNFLASGPLKAHGSKLQSILNEMAVSVGLAKPPIVEDGKPLGVTEEFAEQVKAKVNKALQ